jgi:hypothetical protein
MSEGLSGTGIRLPEGFPFTVTEDLPLIPPALFSTLMR